MTDVHLFAYMGPMPWYLQVWENVRILSHDLITEGILFSPMSLALISALLVIIVLVSLVRKR